MALAGTFGKVVTIGGQANDLALDEARGVLYVANFTANRIEVMSLASNTIQTSINVPKQPNGISLSPDGHWLLVSHYGNRTSTPSTPATQTNALTLIDLTAANARQTFALGNPPLGIAFGIDNKALVVTSQDFLLFDPALGTTEVIMTVGEVATKAIPQPPATFPSSFTQASVAASRDGLIIGGFSDSIIFRYRVATHGITASSYGASPILGPRTVSLSNDGSQMSLGWWMLDPSFTITSVFGKPSGLLSLGSTLIDSSRGLVYAQVPGRGDYRLPPTQRLPFFKFWMQITSHCASSFNCPENLTGKSVLSADNNTAYAVADSGVLVLPVGRDQQCSAADHLCRGPGLSWKFLRSQCQPPINHDYRSGWWKHAVQH
jgi:DNA-binding beta-propeller fold protein YncE